MARRKNTDLAHLLKELDDAARNQNVTIRDLRDCIGRRAFAPMLLLASVLGVTPISGIPGVPTTLAVIVILIAGQIALGRDTVWAPRRLLNLKINPAKLRRAVRTLKPFARHVDRLIRPRLTVLTQWPSSAVIVAACALLALSVPPLEFVPFVDWPLWGAMVALSLALFSHDGLLVIVAFALTALGIFLITAAVF
jgi:hypothetical protein